MTDVTNRNRVTKGLSTGGQFATEAKAEPSAGTNALTAPTQTRTEVPAWMIDAAETALRDIDPDEGNWPTGEMVEAIVQSAAQDPVARMSDAVTNAELAMREVEPDEDEWPTGDMVEAIIEATRGAQPTTQATRPAPAPVLSAADAVAAYNDSELFVKRAERIRTNLMLTAAHAVVNEKFPGATGLVINTPTGGRRKIGGVILADGTKEGVLTMSGAFGQDNAALMYEVERFARTTTGAHHMTYDDKGRTVLQLRPGQMVQHEHVQDAADSADFDEGIDTTIANLALERIPGFLEFTTDVEGNVNSVKTTTGCHDPEQEDPQEAAARCAAVEDILDEVGREMSTRTGVRWTPDRTREGLPAGGQRFVHHLY